MKINIPFDVEKILKELQDKGFEAYIVGGCVRDFLMGKIPHDFDVTTNAMPYEIKQVFKNYKVIETGIVHGTVTVIYNKHSYEITTYRIDGKYEDNRHPSQVIFVSEIEKDLSRRDFTLNAMAYNYKNGLVDFFNGLNDIEKKQIRCVGNPDNRFKEDALRILRALRFSSVLGFGIENNTSKSILNNKELLKNISCERIRDELCKLIMGDNVFEVMTKYRDVFSVFIPEFEPCFDFDQQTKHHCYTVYDHIIKSIQVAPKDLEIRLCMLFHDIGKPESFHSGVENGHFEGHQYPSAKKAENIMKRLKFDNDTIKNVTLLIKEHDNRYPAERKVVRRYIAKYGYDFFNKQIAVRLADTMAQSMYVRDYKLKLINDTLALGKKINKENSCLTLKQLAVDGNDIMQVCNCEGKVVGDILNQLLSMVIDEKLPNDRDILLKEAKKIQP